MEDKLSKCLTSFRKSQGTQLLLVTMIEKWEKAVDKRECVSILFLDLSNTFESINHDLLPAKLKAYGYSLNALKLMHSYLKNRKQQVQIKRAIKFYFTHDSCVVIIVYNTGHISLHFLHIILGKWFLIFLCFIFFLSVLSFQFGISFL